MSIPFQNLWLRVRTIKNGTHEYSTFELPKAGGIVVPFTPEGKVILVEQFRVPLGKRTLEFPAGSFEKKDQTHRRMIERELREETGFKAQTITLLSKVHIIPAMSPSVSYLFKATGCKKVQEQSLDEGEIGMKVRILSKEAVEEAIRKGRINAAEHITAWHFAQKK